MPSKMFRRTSLFSILFPLSVILLFSFLLVVVGLNGHLKESTKHFRGIRKIKKNWKESNLFLRNFNVVKNVELRTYLSLLSTPIMSYFPVYLNSRINISCYKQSFNPILAYFQYPLLQIFVWSMHPPWLKTIDVIKKGGRMEMIPNRDGYFVGKSRNKKIRHAKLE